MAKERILVVEDDEAIVELIVYNLSKEGYAAVDVDNGEDALRKIKTETFHCVLLDLMLPGIDGLDVCRAIRKNPSTHMLPLIMVTAKGEEADVVSGLELGADDYIVKPFSTRVLIARIKSVLRRKSKVTTEGESPLMIFGLTIHPGRREVFAGNDKFELTNSEFRALYFLASQPGWVFTRYQIVNAIKGEDYPVTDRSVDVLIVGLRRKLGEYGNCIETVRGVGYRFKEVAA